MGNRAIITTPARKVGLYLHWDGGREFVEPLLRYCELQLYRPPSVDNYGWARLCQVAGNFFGGCLDVGIDSYTTDEQMDPGDNGIYIIDGWKIVEHLRFDWDEDRLRSVLEDEPPIDFYAERGDMLHAFDEAMPEKLRLNL